MQPKTLTNVRDPVTGASISPAPCSACGGEGHVPQTSTTPRNAWALCLACDGAGWCEDEQPNVKAKPGGIADPAPKHDAVNHPKHYTNHPSGIECIEVTRHMSFNLGNVVKYLWRADIKADALEDLQKAAWYLNDEIQRRTKARPTVGAMIREADRIKRERHGIEFTD